MATKTVTRAEMIRTLSLFRETSFKKSWEPIDIQFVFRNRKCQAIELDDKINEKSAPRKVNVICFEFNTVWPDIFSANRRQIAKLRRFLRRTQ